MNGLLHAHSGLRWLFLLLLLMATFTHFLGKKNGITYDKNHKRLALFTLILAHIQLILGFGLYVGKGWHRFEEGFMANATSRFFSVEHIAGMLIAIILITVGYSSAKKIVDEKKKFGKIFTFYLIALILVLVSIPWPFRNGLSDSGWF